MTALSLACEREHLGVAPPHVSTAGPVVPQVAQVPAPAPVLTPAAVAPALTPMPTPTAPRRVLQPVIVPAKLADLDDDLVLDPAQIVRIGVA